MWNKQAMVSDHVTRSGKVTVTDEAFAELCVLNYFDKQTNGGCTRWTNDHGANSNFQAWSKEAYVKFDEICVHILEQCKTGEDMESGFLLFSKSKYGCNGRETASHHSHGIQNAPELFNDLSGIL